ncbi:lytic transglycosylase domain-containing protein [Xanthomonas graminis]|uniref:Virb1 protein n=1 Tax=Xanthomonas graminis pv. phlei TaxID=487906 RepID=A0A0K2ZDV0_9XANT|nr:lytic transglycosylase domain-containing protein [Xanthomonas translucens]UKE67142.1 lytic transglycosylase domain-containing protein [Xanthomonas translucens pv. phlei]CTP83761.1 virb1 protein [Xanthomonas translucens pv. phlei]
MLPGMELLSCPEMAVPAEVMQHVVRVESSRNPFAIGVVGGRLVRQPQNISEAVATARMLEEKGYNFSLGLGQVNRYNLVKYGLDSYEKAFKTCPNLQAASRILAECYSRSGGNWGKSFSCYYSGNFETGFKHGYVQKVYASINQGRVQADIPAGAIPLVSSGVRRIAGGTAKAAVVRELDSVVSRRIEAASQLASGLAAQPQPSALYQAAAAAPVQQAAVVAAGGSTALPAAASDPDLYVIRPTGAGKGVAMPAVSGADSASHASAGGPQPAAGAAVPGLNRPPPPPGDGAFVF